MGLDLAAQLLSQLGLTEFNQGANLFDRAYTEGGRRFDDTLRRIQQQSQYERQEAFQREENRKARKAQEKQADKARKDSWTKFGIGAGTAAAGGALALAPTMAAVPAVAGAAAPVAETVGATGVNAAAAPALTNAASATAMANPAGMPMAAGATGATASPAIMAAQANPTFNPANASMPLSPSSSVPGITYPTAATSTMPRVVTPADFQTGTVGSRALRGAALGALGFMSGQNLLGPELAAPFENFNAYTRAATTAQNYGMEAAKLAETMRHNKANEANFNIRTDMYRDRPGGTSTQRGAWIESPDGQPLNLGNDAFAHQLATQYEAGDVEFSEVMNRLNQRSKRTAMGRPPTTQPTERYTFDPLMGGMRGGVSVPPGADPNTVKQAMDRVQNTVSGGSYQPAPSPAGANSSNPPDTFDGAKMRLQNYVNEGKSKQDQAALVNGFNFLTPAQKKALQDWINGG